jgi:hypothetical protein
MDSACSTGCAYVVTIEEVAQKLRHVDQLRAVTARAHIHPDDAETLKDIITAWEADVCRAYVNIPPDLHHFRTVTLAHALADSLIEDIEDSSIAGLLSHALGDFALSIQAMRQHLPQPDIGEILPDVLAAVHAEIGPHFTN